MDLSGLLNISTMFLIVLTIAVIALLLTFMTMKRRDELRLSQIAIRDDVRERREQRLILIEQALAMFEEGNKHAESLSKLSELYRSIDSEEKEILWEDKYIKVMRKFMALAKKQAPANMRDAWKMLNSSVNANEAALDTAREAYIASKASMKQFEAFPQRYILMAGDKLSLSVRYAEHIKRQYREQRDAQAGDETREGEIEEDNAKSEQRSE